MMQDFWSVVWDSDVRVIVMLTAESEGGQLKCHPYWKGNDLGPIRLRVLSEKKVSLDIDKRSSPVNVGAGTTESSMSSTQPPSPDPFFSEGARRRANTTTTLDPGTQTTNPFNFTSQAPAASETPYIIIRKFALSHAAHPFLPIREITQLHYPSWPDFGAPAQPSHLLALVELANVMQRAALPVDVPGALASASTSRHNSSVAADGATSNPFFTPHGSSRGSSSSLKRAESDGMPLSWQDGPVVQGHARPMLVHCSAGCGRTGAFCTVDSVIDMLKRQKQHVLGHPPNGTASRAQNITLDRDLDGDISMDEGPEGPSTTDQHHDLDDDSDIDTGWLDDDSIDLISQTVEDFRGQRLSMVQSLRQFVLCYETVLEWIRRLQESGGGGADARGRGRSGSLAF
jgi:protein-tyrosine phosphatase